ncbi:MAG: hypothetical protein UIM24_05690 [Clostridia bacterium]|nr:hypothetical protein [Clostridia bacterium]
MEIVLAILAYLFHCFTAFSLIYSYDEAKIWGDIDKDECPKLHMPKLDELKENELLELCEDDSEEEKERKIRINEHRKKKNKELRQNYIDEKIKPAALYFPLLEEIDYYQSKYRSGFTQFIIQIFSLLLCSQMLIRIDFLESVIGTILIVALVCTLSSYIIYLIYNKYWRCHKIRMKHFNYEHYCNSDDKYIINSHYDYLCSIKETVYFRYSIRKIFDSTSMIIFLLFMPMPD